MRVLVTGATGHLGSAIADALLARGDEVVGLTRDPRKARPRNPTITWHEWQPAIERPPPEAFAEVDAVVNMVGEEINQRLTDHAKERIRASRVDAAHNLLQGIGALPEDERPGTFVGQSAIGYYGERGEAILDEDSPPGEGFGAEIPIEWERAQAEAEQVGMRLVILRTAPVIARDSGLVKQLLLPFKLGLGGPMAGGEQFLSWIHVDDLVGIVLWALDNDHVGGVLNAASPEPVRNSEFSRALASALNRPAFLPTPKFAVAALRGRELAEMVVGSARVVPRRATDLGFRFRHPEIDEAIESELKGRE